MIKEKYLERIPTWYKEICNRNGLILSDDVDSLLTCIILQNIFDVKITGFYTFNGLNKVVDDLEAQKENIFIDADITSGKGFGNHVTRLEANGEVNPEIVSLNAVFKTVYANSFQYHGKYAGSTLLTVMSLYDCDFSSFSDTALMLLLAIDSSYLGYYSQYENDRTACKFYLCEVLNLECLYRVLENHKKSDFEQLRDSINLSGKITINENGYLKTDMDLFWIGFFLDINLELPKDKFVLKETYKTGYSTLEEFRRIEKKFNIVSLAATSKYRVCYSYENKKSLPNTANV